MCVCVVYVCICDKCVLCVTCVSVTCINIYQCDMHVCVIYMCEVCVCGGSLQEVREWYQLFSMTFYPIPLSQNLLLYLEFMVLGEAGSQQTLV